MTASFYTSFYLRGDHVHYRGYKEGRRLHLKHKYKPFIFLDAPQKSNGYRNIDGRPVAKKLFESVTEARGFIDQYENVNGFHMYGLTNFEYVFINEVFPEDMKFDSSVIRVGFLDIEVAADEGFPSIEKADKPITAITIKVNGQAHVFGCGKFKTDRKDVWYYECASEIDLLSKFLVIWNDLDLDIISGWNVRFFDIPYLVNRIRHIFNDTGKENKLSPWKHIYKKEVEIRGKMNVSYEIQGIATLDYLELYRKFTFKNHESYRLDYISQEELEERKLDYSEYGSLLGLYKNDYQKFIEYNIRDVELVERLELKLRFIELVQELAYDAKCNYIDVLTTIRPWDVIIHNYLMKKNIVVPFMSQHLVHDIVGGYVKEAKGLYNWVVSFDLVSLYPHIMMGYNISPDTYLGRIAHLNEAYELKGQKLLRNYDWSRMAEPFNCTVTANGCKYRNDVQGFMPALLESKFQDRDKYKKEMLYWKKIGENLSINTAPATEIMKASNEEVRFHNKQLAKKIQLNSLYGALLNPFNRWFSYHNGEAVTTTGQLVIRFVGMVLNQHFNDFLLTKDVDYIIASDTDSVYLCMEEFVKKCTWYQHDRHEPLNDQQACDALDIYCKKVIDPLLKKAFSEFCQITRAYQEKFVMKREVIATKGLWRAKKMYALNVLDNEGVRAEKAKLLVHGLETVRSSTPQVCRDALKEAIYIIMNEGEDDLIEYIKTFRAGFYKMGFEDIALPRSVNNINEYAVEELGKLYKKGTPIHVKSAINYNYLIQIHNLHNLQPIYNGDKMKFCYLKTPNPIYDTCIGAPNILPPEFGLDKYLDKETQFEKTFLNPLQSLTEIIGWETERTARLF